MFPRYKKSMDILLLFVFCRKAEELQEQGLRKCESQPMICERRTVKQGEGNLADKRANAMCPTGEATQKHKSLWGP